MVSEKKHIRIILEYTFIYPKLGNFKDPAAAASKSLQLCPTLCDPTDPGNVKYWDGFGICKLVKAMKMNHTKVLVAKNTKVYLLLRMHKYLQCQR